MMMMAEVALALTVIKLLSMVFQLDDGVHNMLPRIPIALQEATSRLIR